MIKLKSLEFYPNGVRKLRNLKLEFAERITLIAGHNGIGKSTILGLIASSSGIQKQSYLDNNFSNDIGKIIHFDPAELEKKELEKPWPKAVYSCQIETGETVEHHKNISITKRQENNGGRLKTVPRTDAESPNKAISGPSAKTPLPTIYLGMVRILPVGESDEKDINCTTENIDSDDASCLKKFVDSVIPNTVQKQSSSITSQSIKNTGKSSKHPFYNHVSKSVSLGQDSLSSIATAIASFNMLKREEGENYQGGLLVIDEIEASLHPRAQQRLIDALESAARKLSLQIIATTHSPTLVKYVHPESPIRKNTNKSIDKIIYLADTKSPKLANWSLDQIISDMSLLPFSSQKGKKIKPLTIKAYLEDAEAVKFLKGILNMTTNYKTFYGHECKKRLRLIPIGVGGSNIVNLPQHDNYFNSTLLIIDADTKIPKKISNAIKLPAEDIKSNPERTIHSYIQELAKGDQSKYENTLATLFHTRAITTDRLTEDFLLTNTTFSDRESSKKWFNKIHKKLSEYRLLYYWAEDHPTEMKNFLDQLENKLMLLRKTQ